MSDDDLLLADLEHWRTFLLRARGTGVKSKGIHIDHLTCAALCIQNAINRIQGKPVRETLEQWRDGAKQNAVQSDTINDPTTAAWCCGRADAFAKVLDLLFPASEPQA